MVLLHKRKEVDVVPSMVVARKLSAYSHITAIEDEVERKEVSDLYNALDRIEFLGALPWMIGMFGMVLGGVLLARSNDALAIIASALVGYFLFALLLRKVIHPIWRKRLSAITAEINRRPDHMIRIRQLEIIDPAIRRVTRLIE